MADSDRSILNPVLRLNKTPTPRATTGGGKSISDIVESRIAEQRQNLSLQLKEIFDNIQTTPTFNGRAIFYACMFDDSFAPTKIPSDLFSPSNGGKLLRSFDYGYLVELEKNKIENLQKKIIDTTIPKEMVDISRVQSITKFDSLHATLGLSIDQLWDKSVPEDNGRRFSIWLMPMQDENAVEELTKTFLDLRKQDILSPPPLLSDFTKRLSTAIPGTVQENQKISSTYPDRLQIAVNDYKKYRRGYTSVIIENKIGLERLIASGTVVRIEPIKTINATAPGEGAEPARPLPNEIDKLPIVGVVDGGLTASSYISAQAWKAPSLVDDYKANTKHGNAVASLIIQGYEWNNNLSLPQLHCRVGTVQAVPKKGSGFVYDPQEFIMYLDMVMGSYPNTKVWNMSYNISEKCDPLHVSYLGHEISKLARKYSILPIISIGNRLPQEIQPPADCEAAITVAGRTHNSNGIVSSACSGSSIGPGPSNMLKPEAAHFSTVRVIGGVTTRGTSYSTALISPIAAHTFDNLKEASPDLVKALIIHNSDSRNFNLNLGFGTPSIDPLPWECRPGYVTLHWSASLQAGTAYYWELPIPASLKENGYLKGEATLTAILNPHPFVDDQSGVNYFGARIEVALQVIKNNGASEKTKNVLGGMDTTAIPELTMREEYNKWSPIRHHHRSFSRISFDGDNMRIYARTYTRDLFAYKYSSTSETPPLDAVFVLSLGNNSEGNDIYNEFRNDLGAFVEPSVIDLDAEIEIE